MTSVLLGTVGQRAENFTKQISRYTVDIELTRVGKK